MKILRFIILSLSIVLLVMSTYFGWLMNYLFIFILIAALTMLATVTVSAVNKQLHWGIFDTSLSLRSYVLRGLLRNATWITIGVCIYLAIIPVQFSPSYYLGLTTVMWAAVILLCLLDWVPRKQNGQSLNVTLGVFLVFLTYQLALIYVPTQSRSIQLTPPLEGDWFVFHGGNSALLNHHYFAGSQKYAMDIILPHDGELPLQQITDLQKYNTFAQTLYAPVDGVVISVKSSLPDQKIGQTDRKNPAGNHIVLKDNSDVFILLAHLKKNSILVNEGDRVSVGQKIAKIGNSGNTSQPHLHIQAMTGANFRSQDSLAVPMSFSVRDKYPKFFKRNDILPGL